ncbi:MAG: hypothetical protein A3J08_01955 [Candidatus Lloydbacteria bacterium RIFCSPLOWO2_02_FULL_51_11]|uniref:Uncharacterized protein n=1 Tax=Candidatus Lloydbacteria bacterium RIFCSPLOWO2_02_FULL_51_11 TaxID=1798667 RepID=A0A1G2DKB0_9BACT|nr:MAG: hypothetical protein A3J08_01955 [Candidatus Lloydbacteria bacterium RIFCSPLOWO2_02_FULL_51_11]
MQTSQTTKPRISSAEHSDSADADRILECAERVRRDLDVRNSSSPSIAEFLAHRGLSCVSELDHKGRLALVEHLSDMFLMLTTVPPPCQRQLMRHSLQPIYRLHHGNTKKAVFLWYTS